jgi:hypothetical protein
MYTQLFDRIYYQTLSVEVIWRECDLSGDKNQNLGK